MFRHVHHDGGVFLWSFMCDFGMVEDRQGEPSESEQEE